MTSKNINVQASAALAACLIIMALPIGVKTAPSPSPMGNFSYFSSQPLAFGNFCPMVTAVLTILSLAAAVFAPKADAKKYALPMLIICINLSLISWFMFSSLTLAGVMVAVLHMTAMFFIK